MLIISEIKSSNLAASVEVDPYVPVTVRTFSEPIGAVFYRVGNFETSLVEVPIDPLSGTVRGIKLVSLDRVGADFDDSAFAVLQGLPITSQESIPPKRYVDDHREVTVSLAGDRLVISWSGSQQIDTKSVHGRLSFLIGSGFLLGAVIECLSQAEQQSLCVHLPSAVPETASSPSQPSVTTPESMT
ncbi:MAG: hypothetical protein SNJ49_09150 [Chloracidobacterium sp.]